MPAINVEELASKRVIDVRTRPEYEEERVPGSIHIPLHKVGRFVDELADSDVAVICRTGKRAAKAAKKLPNAQVVHGGIQAYKRAGGSVEGGLVRWSVQRQVRLIAGSLVLVGVLLGWAINPWWFVLSAFVGAGLVFAGVTDSCGMAKLLARASWNSCSDAEISRSLE